MSIANIKTRLVGVSSSLSSFIAGERRQSWTAKTSPSKYTLTMRRSPYVFLPILFAAAFYTIWVLSFTNGFLPKLKEVVEAETPLFPTTDAPLRAVYTSVEAIDAKLRTLVGFFAPLTEGTNTDLNLYGVYGFGQFGAGWTLLFMESLRRGNQGKAVSFAGVYGFLVQTFAFGVITPLYLLLHLLTSPIAKPFPSTHSSSVLLVSSYDLALLPISITFSYIIPSILVALPAPFIFSYDAHQAFIAAWQLFPIWTATTHWFLRKLCTVIFGEQQKDYTPTKQSPPTGNYLVSAGRVYTFVLVLCIVTHIPVVVIGLTPSFLIPKSFPTLLALSKSTISSIFVPSLPLMSNRVSSLSAGVLQFLQWDLYTAGLASLLWGTVLYRNACVEREIVDPNKSLPVFRELLTGERYPENGFGRLLGLRLLFWMLVSGPFGALAVVLWNRDVIVTQKIKQDQ